MYSQGQLTLLRVRTLSIRYSIIDQSSFAATTMRSVVMEEMLHMVNAANVLNAIGGTPFFDHPDFIPKYPLVSHSLLVLHLHVLLVGWHFLDARVRLHPRDEINLLSCWYPLLAAIVCLLRVCQFVNTFCFESSETMKLNSFYSPRSRCFLCASDASGAQHHG